MADSYHKAAGDAEHGSEAPGHEEHQAMTTEHAAHGDPHGAHETPNPISPDTQMVILTWITFGIVATLLYKVAWKPILSALESREGRIRNALTDAKKAKEELEQIEQTRTQMIADTDRQTKEMIARAREDAAKAAAQVEASAHEKVKILYENAERDIEAMKTKTLSELRREQSDIVINLAGRLIRENMDSDRNRKLTEQFIAEL